MPLIGGRKRAVRLYRAKPSKKRKKERHTSKAFLILPLSWLTEAERASGLIRDAASPVVFQWFSNDQRD